MKSPLRFDYDVEVGWATAVACVLSLVTLSLALVSVPVVYNEVADIRRELRAEMHEYKPLEVLSDELWSEIVVMGKSSDATARRQARSAYGEAYDANEAAPPAPAAPEMDTLDIAAAIEAEALSRTPIFAEPSLIIPQPKCNCEATNKCPIGAPGAKGAKGQDGAPGGPGQQGRDGRDAQDVVEQTQQFGECFHCPAGHPGIPGAPGRSGSRGMRGARGQPGGSGRNGMPGASGAPGDDGPRGISGRPGPQGDTGSHGNAYKALPGPKGQGGAIGQEGDAGYAGEDGKDGEPGEEGPTGPTGPPGRPGLPGPEGQEGTGGINGKDAQYCPCPRRSEFLGAGAQGGFGEEKEKEEHKAAPQTEGYGRSEPEPIKKVGEPDEPEDEPYGQAAFLEPPQEPQNIPIHFNGGYEQEAPATTTPGPLTVGPVRDAGSAYGGGAPPAPPPRRFFVPSRDPQEELSSAALEATQAAGLGTPELETKNLHRAKLISKGGKASAPPMIPIHHISTYGRYQRKA